ncbi:MAG: homocysteine S-methyltransferase family protein [Ignavibacteriales bacterium]|nr:homocysteine S-methyltransferase family protein [Ignavibacteriales bacterium]
MFNYFIFAKNVKRPLIMDGATGSLLIKMGIKPDHNLWTSAANIFNPEIVFSLHKKYLMAGADIITTNTFRTNPAAVKKSNFDQAQLVEKGVLLAKHAGKKYNVLIAGSNPPAEDCYERERTITQKELRYNHHKHISQLIEYGSDFVLNETQSHFDEIKIISEYSSKKDIPFVVSLFIDQKLNLLSGENVFKIIDYLKHFPLLAIGINCVSPDIFFQTVSKFFRRMNWGFYLNCGKSEHSSGKIICSVSPDDYLKTVKLSLDKSPSYIGACCGSTPKHISKLKKYFDGKINNSNTG